MATAMHLPALAVAVIVAQPQAEPVRLPPRVVKNLGQAAQAWRAGRLQQVIGLLQPVFESSTAEQLAAADTRLRDQYGVQSSVKELLIRSRILLVLQGRARRLRPPRTKALPLVLTALEAELSKRVEPVQGLLAAEPGQQQQQADQTAADSGQQLSELAGRLEQLDQAELLVGHLQSLTGRLRPAVVERLAGRARELATRDYAAQRQQLGELRRRLLERLVGRALGVLDQSVRELGDEQAGLDQRFAAAQRGWDSLAVLQRCSDQYQRLLRGGGPGMDQRQQQRWHQAETQLRRAASAVLPKVYHYREGLRWWLRGRFGIGPQESGLVKALPKGLRGQRLLEAALYYPLLMPEPISKPADPQANPRRLPFARRHLLLWQYETRVPTRRLERVARNFMMVLPADGKGPPTPAVFDDRLPHLPPFIEPTPEDRRLAQLVGYVEYQTALRHFERLLQITSAAERQVLDQMVKADDRVVVYSDLSGKFDSLEPGSRLRIELLPGQGAGRAAGNERRGLAWVMALARVEWGAMRAGFSYEARSEVRRRELAQRTRQLAMMASTGPFDKWPPTALEHDAFVELLLDGARQHYYELRTRYMFPPAVPTSGGTGRGMLSRSTAYMLQYDRKLSVTIEMIEALRHYAGGSLDPAQQRELAGWLQWLEQRYMALSIRFRRPERVQKMIDQLRGRMMGPAAKQQAEQQGKAQRPQQRPK